MMTSSNGNIFCVTSICAGNSPVPGEFPTQRPVMRSFDVFCDLRLNKRLSKQSRRRWFETPSCPLCRDYSGVLCRAATLYQVLRLISQMLPKSIVGYMENSLSPNDCSRLICCRFYFVFLNSGIKLKLDERISQQKYWIEMWSIFFSKFVVSIM